MDVHDYDYDLLDDEYFDDEDYEQDLSENLLFCSSCDHGCLLPNGDIFGCEKPDICHLRQALKSEYS